LPPVARLEQAVRWALAALALAALSTVCWNPGFPVWIRAAVVIAAALGAARPREMLLVVAAVGPFANLLVVATGSPPLRAFEALVLAFLAGWLLRPPAHRAGSASRRLLLPVTLLIVIVATSSVALALELHRASDRHFADTMATLRHWYLWTDDITGVAAAAMIVEGAALAFAVVELTERRSRLALALIAATGAAGAAAAALSILLAVGIIPDVPWIHSGLPQRRFVVHVTDINAAGSYFAMIAGLSFGMAASTRGIRQRLWIAALVMSIVGVGLSGSRSAVAALVLVTAAAAVWVGRSHGVGQRLSPRAGWGLAIGVGLIAVIVFVRMPLFFGSQMRREFTLTSVRMIAARPILGVGVGRYYTLSRLILTPRLGALYAEENAHNYSLQIGAELGLAGLAAFVWLVAALLWPAARSLSDPSRDFVSAGLFASAIVFLLTSFSGHPFLVREVSFPFWMLIGVATVASQSHAPPTRPAWMTRVAVGAIAFLIVGVGFRPGVPRLRLKPLQDGLGPVQMELRGRRFRDMGAYGSLFVGPTVTGVEIPVRLADAARTGPRMRVWDQEPGWSQHQTIVGADWVIVRVTLPTADPLMPYQRINLSVERLDGTLPPNPEAPIVAVGDLVITDAAP